MGDHYHRGTVSGIEEGVERRPSPSEHGFKRLYAGSIIDGSPLRNHFGRDLSGLWAVIAVVEAIIDEVTHSGQLGNDNGRANRSL
ncbi:MAG: hypothetical protein ABI170_04080 [Microbacteriaceae bacterium]